MLKEQNAFFQAVNTLIDNKLKKQKFNYYVSGVIKYKNINTSNKNTPTYTVNIFGFDYDNVPTKNGWNYSPNDIVYVLIQNGDFNKKYIDGYLKNEKQMTYYPIGTVYTLMNDSNNPSNMFGGTWDLVKSQYVDTGWRKFSSENKDYIGTTQSPYTQNKWRVKDNVLYINIGVGSTTNIDTYEETTIANIPIKGNTSFDSNDTRIWNSAVGGSGRIAGFGVMQLTDSIKVFLKPHTSNSFPVAKWYSTHFAIPLDETAMITDGKTYDKEYVWKRIS